MENLYNNYLFRAIESYPYELERAVEALNYALSYDPENAKALALLAKVQSEQLGDVEMAKEYYAKALASRMDMLEIYPEYIRLLINNDDFEEAQKLIDYAFTVKGIDKSGIKLNQAHLFEACNEFQKAIKAYKEAKKYALNNSFTGFVNEELNRVKKKYKKMKKKSEKMNDTPNKTENENSKKNWLINRLNSFF